MMLKLGFVVGVVASLGLSSAFAEDSKGVVEFYKGGDHSSTSHFMITGPAALSMYNHMTEVAPVRDDHQGIIVKRNANMDCTFYYKDILREQMCRDVMPPNHTPDDLAKCLEAAKFYRCEFHMDERGLIQGGYSE